MADLYQTSRSNVTEHLLHIYEEGELDEKQLVGNSDKFGKKVIDK